jgi:hypothetical protein
VLEALHFDAATDDYLTGIKAMVGQWWSAEYKALQR